MKIAFFNYLPLEYGGGLARAYTDTATGLLERCDDLEISLVTLTSQFASQIGTIYKLYFGVDPLSKHIKKRDIEELKRKLGKVKYYQASSFKELMALLSQHDIVYCKNDIMETFFLRYFVGYSKLPPVIIGFHTPVYYEMADSLRMRLHNAMYSPVIYDFLLKPANAFHVLNDFDKELLTKRFPGKPVYKIYNPFDVKKFKFVKKDTHNKHVKLLWVGRLTREKGADELIKIVKNLKSSRTVHWTIVGEGELQQEIDALQNKYNNVTHIPSVDYKDMPSLYQSHDFFVMTSKCECFPYVLLEAHASGMPVIAYNIHGVDDIVDKKTGILVKKKDDFVVRLGELIEKNNFSHDSIAKNIEKKFDYEQNYTNLYKMFMSVYEKPLR